MKIYRSDLVCLVKWRVSADVKIKVVNIWCFTNKRSENPCEAFNIQRNIF